MIAARAAGLAIGIALLGCGPSAFAADPEFRHWLEATWPQVQAAGVTRATFERETRGLEPDLGLPDLVIPGRPPPGGEQPEFVQKPADYLRSETLASLAREGRELLKRHGSTLAAIERRFGVAPPVLLAIWGRETAFGKHRLRHDAIRVLATQAYLGRRKDLFRPEFALALKMLQDGVVKRADMRSSWAGAMGLTQFLPSEFYKQGVDFDGDGRVDIWRSVPDALASAAKQLVDKGWQPGERWAFEVKPPRGFDCTLSDPARKMLVEDWVAMGFVPADGRALTGQERKEPASLMLPEGNQGPAFLTPRNYFVIKDYNFADLYVLFVGNLSDRIAGRSDGFATPWVNIAQLRTRDVEAVQRELTARGFYADKVDGKAGMKTRNAIGAYQKANGLKIDCWPSPALLSHMRPR